MHQSARDWLRCSSQNRRNVSQIHISIFHYYKHIVCLWWSNKLYITYCLFSLDAFASTAVTHNANNPPYNLVVTTSTHIPNHCKYYRLYCIFCILHVVILHFAFCTLHFARCSLPHITRNPDRPSPKCGPTVDPRVVLELSCRLLKPGSLSQVQFRKSTSFHAALATCKPK